MFRGYVDKEKTAKRNSPKGRINTARGFLESPIKQDVKGSFDIPTIIELEDGKLAYDSAKINKNYRQKVSSTQILRDCIDAMNIGIAKFSDKLPATEYNTYKAVGSPHVVMQKICKSLNIRFCIVNGLIQVIAPDEKFDGEFAILLNPENSMRPERLGENELAIPTRFIPFANPNDWAQCDFREFEGTERIRQVHHKINNYGTIGETEIIIGFDKLKKNEEERKRKVPRTANDSLVDILNGFSGAMLVEKPCKVVNVNSQYSVDVEYYDNNDIDYLYNVPVKHIQTQKAFVFWVLMQEIAGRYDSLIMTLQVITLTANM